MNAEQQTDFAEAREVQWAWKTPAMEAMAAAICQLALERGAHREFSANDLVLADGHRDHGGQGICGAVFHRLAKDDVISPVGGFIDREFQQKTVPNAGKNRIGVWRLKSAPRASTLLRIHRANMAAKPVLKQADLLPAA